MSQKIKEMDQNSWVSYKFEGGEYYYGQIGYLDEGGVVHPGENSQMASNPKNKLVKHGFGIYVYGSEGDANCRYEGYWQKNEKNGDGILRMKNDCVYEGKFREGYYHGSGKLKFENGDFYQGNWKRGRMEGPGLFKRNDGLSLKGSFKNNYFIDGNNLRNPMMSEKQYEQLKKRRKQINKQYQKNEKAKTAYLERIFCKNFDSILECVKKSSQNNRVPLILTSEEANFNLTCFTQQLKQKNIQFRQVDLRKGYACQGQARYNFKKQLTNTIQQSLRKGYFLIINLDESESQFEEMFYPDIKQFYEPNGFNQTLWSPKDLRKEEIRKKLIENDEVHENFRIVGWTKKKFTQTTSSDFLYEKVKKRYECVIPFIKIDIIFGQKCQEEEKVEANEQSQ